jgi:hypothetical protein
MQRFSSKENPKVQRQTDNLKGSAEGAPYVVRLARPRSFLDFEK